ncbi:hypothetical protein D9M70_600840 [compost metagenome]
MKASVNVNGWVVERPRMSPCNRQAGSPEPCRPSVTNWGNLLPALSAGRVLDWTGKYRAYNFISSDLPAFTGGSEQKIPFFAGSNVPLGWKFLDPLLT